MSWFSNWFHHSHAAQQAAKDFEAAMHRTEAALQGLVHKLLPVAEAKLEKLLGEGIDLLIKEAVAALAQSSATRMALIAAEDLPKEPENEVVV